MKYLIVIILFISCRNAGSNDTTTAPAVASTECDSLRVLVDSLQKKIFVANYKLQRVRQYVNIVNKSPSQGKYLKGWITRAIDE